MSSWTLPTGERVTTCPRILANDDEVHELMDWYSHYLNGVLPVAGGLLDQSGFYLDAMTCIERWTKRAG